MNLLLLEPGQFTVRGERARIVRERLKKAPGATLFVGVLGRGSGQARVMHVGDDGAVTLALDTLVDEPPPRTVLVLALPRPKGLSRIFQAAASFGVTRIIVTGAARVDLAYFDSPRLAPARVREDLVLGLEQGRRVHLPEFTLCRELAGALRELDDVRGSKLVLHPGSPLGLREALEDSTELHALALGPDGGFIQSELDHFESNGFVRASLGGSVLRTEVAVAAALAQRDLLLGP